MSNKYKTYRLLYCRNGESTDGEEVWGTFECDAYDYMDAYDQLVYKFEDVISWRML